MKTITTGYGRIIDNDTMTVACGSDSEKDSTLKLAGLGGVVVHGRAGIGKTVLLQTFAGELVNSGYGGVTVIDGKGGSEWTSLQVDAIVSSDVEEDILKKIHEFEEGVERRLEELGGENYWDTLALERLISDMPFEVLIVDECSEIVESKAAVAALTNIMKLAPDAGVVVILSTQRCDLIPDELIDALDADLNFISREETVVTVH